MIILASILDNYYIQMTSDYKLINNIKTQRKSKRISQEKLAERLGISRTALGSIERGEACPSTTLALCICSVLECNFEDLFYLENKSEP